MELQRGERIARDLLALAAVVVGEPDDATLVISLDQHDARARAHVTCDGGHGHGVGFGHLTGDGLVQPLVELLERIALGRFFAEFRALVALAQIGDVRGEGSGHAAIVPRQTTPIGIE